MVDAHKNFAYSTVATAPSPATSGTSLVVASGHGARFPSVPFNATIWPSSSVPTPANAEIVRVTAISTDTLTITRAQESSTARSVIVGDQIAATITNQTLTDIETLLANIGKGCSIYNSSDQAIGLNTTISLDLDSETEDTSAYHFTSAAALTGTVSNTNGSAVITGSGTSFTTELSVNQVVTIPGGATEVFVVKTIDSNTQFTAWQNAANTASGQTATRDRKYLAVPAGLGGMYLIAVRGTIPAAAGTNGAGVGYRVNAGTLHSYATESNSNINIGCPPTVERVRLAAGDYIEMRGFNNDGGTNRSVKGGVGAMGIDLTYLSP